MTPILFLGGRPDKVAQAEDEFPDAAFAGWADAGPALAEAIAHPPVDPVVPESDSGPGSPTPLRKKLGIREGSVIVLDGAPEGFASTLGPLPSGAAIRRSNRGARDITICFETSAPRLSRRIELLARQAGEGMLWLAWPKGSSGLETDLTQSTVQRAGLDAGLVDSKVCAIDEDWSGLRFTRRR